MSVHEQEREVVFGVIPYCEFLNEVHEAMQLGR